MATPSSSSISATEPFSGSKNSARTLSQPPNLSISNRPGGVGKFSSSCELLQDRAVALLLVDPLRLLGEEEVAEGLCLRIGVSVTATGFSIRIVSSGMT